ncbi:hypothetical protein PIB30_103973 [Stylosanthes scabra]|uniref:Uncharacterized protein n=1 Tax=Stylosanthes scabra TaxID=79078 RepID=A0ABU6UYG5_9FABA|nr:hypothetical protein [Stylosanthes scabra]
MKENQKRLDSQLSHITELLHKYTNQPTANPQPQPFTSSPLPSQPLPNPKRGINMVHNENDEEEEEGDDDEWLYGFLAELEDFDDDSDDEDRNEVKETELPVKCEDPGPCLVTSRIRGVDIPECLCDPGACGNVMPYALYETLDLRPLKKSKEVFTTVDASIVSVAGIADNVMTARFKLQYDDDTFSLSVGKITEIFHVTRPPAPRKKGAHPLQVSAKKIGSEKLLKSEKGKEVKNLKNDACMKKGLRIAPLSLKKDGKKENSKPAKKKKHEEVKTRKKKKHEEDVDGGRIALKCSSLGNFLGKLKKIGKALRNNKKINAHLGKEQSKWK